MKQNRKEKNVTPVFWVHICSICPIHSSWASCGYWAARLRQILIMIILVNIETKKLVDFLKLQIKFN